MSFALRIKKADSSSLPLLGMTPQNHSQNYKPRDRTCTRSPASILSRSGGTTKRQFARVMATTSPEPCHGIGETLGGSGAGGDFGVREPGSRCSGAERVEAAKAAAGLPHSKTAGRK